MVKSQNLKVPVILKSASKDFKLLKLRKVWSGIHDCFQGRPQSCFYSNLFFFGMIRARSGPGNLYSAGMLTTLSALIRHLLTTRPHLSSGRLHAACSIKSTWLIHAHVVYSCLSWLRSFWRELRWYQANRRREKQVCYSSFPSSHSPGRECFFCCSCSWIERV